RMLGVVAVDIGGVDGALREHGAGDRGEREREQQEQRGAHGGQLMPPAAGEGPGRLPERGARGGRGGSFHRQIYPAPNVPRSQVVNSVQAPVASMRPTATSMTPPVTAMALPCRFMKSRALASRCMPTAKSTNGRPRPRQ